MLPSSQWRMVRTSKITVKEKIHLCPFKTNWRPVKIIQNSHVKINDPLIKRENLILLDDCQYIPWSVCKCTLLAPWMIYYHSPPKTFEFTPKPLVFCFYYPSYGKTSLLIYLWTPFSSKWGGSKAYKLTPFVGTAFAELGYPTPQAGKRTGTYTCILVIRYRQ